MQGTALVQFFSFLALGLLTWGFQAPFGKKFVYNYDSQIATGVVDKVISQVAGFSLKATVAVQWQLERESVYFKFSNVSFGEFNKQISNVFETWDLPKQVTSPEIEDFIRELEEPFWISAGPQETVNVEHGSLWKNAANFKLSFASLFQIIVRRDSEAYIEMEEGITGRCPVIYRLSKSMTDDTHDRILNITKVVLYDKCETREHRLRFSISGHKCNQCDDMTQPLKTKGKTYYQIRVNKVDDESESMSFEKIDSNGAIIFTPFGSDGNTVLSLTNQSLTLLSVSDEVDEHPSDLIAEPAVGFVFPPKRNDLNAMAEAERKIGDMIKVYATFDTQSISIMEFVLLFRDFKFNDFEVFFARHVNLDVGKSGVREGEIRIALLQVLSCTGTEASVRYIMHLINQKKITRHLAAELIRIVPSHVQTPSLKLLADFSSFAHSYEINQFEDVLQEAVWLAFGTIIKKSCVAASLPFFRTEKLDSGRLKECNFYFESLMADFHLTTNMKQQLLILRTIQNIQLPQVTEFALAILQSHLHSSLRRMSVWGVMRLTERKLRLEATSTLMGIAFNSSEDILLRLYAFEALFYLSPTAETLTLLVDQFNREPNQQISSYIYSTLITMANSTDPCTQSLSVLAKQALQFINSRRYDTLRYSKNKVFSYYNDKYKFGRTFQFAYVASNESIFPREIYTGHSLKLFGYSFNFRDMIFHLGDVDTYLKQYFEELPTDQREPDDFLNKLPNRTRTRELEIPQIIQMYFGEEVISSVPFGRKGAHCLYEKNKYRKDSEGVHHDVLMRCIKFSFMDVELTVANDMGFLTTLQLHVPFTYKMGWRTLTNITALKINKPRGAMAFHFKFGSNFMVKTSLFVEPPINRKYGYSLKTHAGMKMSIVSNIELNNTRNENEEKTHFSAKYYPTKEPYNLFFYKSTPKTFAHTAELNYPSNIAEKQNSFTAGHKHLGIGLTFNYSFSPLWKDLVNLKPFFTDNYFEWSDKLFAGFAGFFDYLLLNPIGKPLAFKAIFKHLPASNHFEVNALLGKKILTSDDSIATVKTVSVDVDEIGEDKKTWGFHLENIESENLKNLTVEFNHRVVKFSPLSNNQSQFVIYFNLKMKTSDLNQMLNDPINNPDEAIKRSYNISIKAGSDAEMSDWLKLDIKGIGINSGEVEPAIFNRCKSDWEKGFEYSFGCWLLRKNRGRLDKFKFDMRDQVSAKTRLHFLQISAWLLHHLYDNLEIGLNPAIGDLNSARVELNFSNPHVNVMILRGGESYKLSNLFIPSFVPHFEPITVVNSEAERFLENALYIHQPKCIISGDYIQTTDRIIYQFPMGACYHVVFADCNSKRVIVLVNQYNKNSKGLKILLDGTEQIEIVNHTVKVNGVRILKTRHWYVHGTSQETFNILKHLNRVDIDATAKFGLHVLFDGKNLVISVTNWLRGLQCGLCGNFDGEKNNEFIRPDGTGATNPLDFAQTYQMKEDECI